MNRCRWAHGKREGRERVCVCVVYVCVKEKKSCIADLGHDAPTGIQHPTGYSCDQILAAHSQHLKGKQLASNTNLSTHGGDDK